ncbi:NAD(P)-binding domain-containing protein [Mycobacterium sp.]|uniref:NAD(P)-dependent oxidoreductase n=1 Tax=Mycobacterium sp. TaxID=1785 RepID=UPI0025ED95C5|nr:NAD(P)-binding domain-containing protein [Mycobacterium sp.]
MRVGFVDLGSQGAPMARRIVDAGFPLTVWARRAETTAAFADTAADIAETPGALASVSDLVCICVVDDAGVGQVVHGYHGVLAGMQPSTTLAIHSTVNPALCRELAARAEQRGITVIDARVSSGGPAAAEGKLLVMTGGDEQVITQCTPAFETFADTIDATRTLPCVQLVCSAHS